MLPAKKTVSSVMSELMSNPAVKSRFNEILGKRSNKFVSALISLINADQNLTNAFVENPMSVLQVAMKAATYDLEIGNDLGFAYIIPFRVNGKPSAQFILGYRGLIQLAKRSNELVKIGASVVREGELKKIDRLYGDCEFEWIQDESERLKKNVIGYVASIKERSGFEKMIFMTKQDMIDYEEKNRKGQFQSPVWKNHFDSMACKTVLRKLLGTYGSLSAKSDSDDDIAREVVNNDDLDSESIDIDISSQQQNMNNDDQESNEIRE